MPSPPKTSMFALFWAITAPVFRSEIRGRVIGLLALLVGFALTLAALNVVNSYVNREFFTAIQRLDTPKFYRMAIIYAVVFVISAITAAFYRFTEESLGLLWRQWMTSQLLQRYLSSHLYLRMQARDDIDNPDQRITEDVKTFTTTSLSIMLILLNTTMTLFAFSSILWTITPWLFFTAVGYAIAGSLMTVFIGQRLVNLNFLQFKAEADLRYELIRIREHADAIALLRGERKERARLLKKLNDVLANFKNIVRVNLNMGFFTGAYNYFIQVIPALIVAPLYMRGQKEFGVVTQSAGAFSQVMGAFSVIVTEFTRISAFVAVINRVGNLWHAVNSPNDLAGPSIAYAIDPKRIAFEKTSLIAPSDGRVLIADLQLEVPQGRRLLVVGPHGSGKSALLRAVAGIWRSGSGTLIRPRYETMMFLPQRPYMMLGTLRSQLNYCGGETGQDDDWFINLLVKMNLESILQRAGGLDVEREWDKVLSNGEMQLLTFLRMSCFHPKFVLFDNALSDLPTEQTRTLYNSLRELGAGYISVGDEGLLRDYHDQVLTLHGDGKWDLADIPNPVPANTRPAT